MEKKEYNKSLPLIICGPILRKTTPDEIVFWWVSTEKLKGQFECWISDDEHPFFSEKIDSANTQVISIGSNAFVNLFSVETKGVLPLGCKIEYNIQFFGLNGAVGLTDLYPDICYDSEARPSFVIQMELSKILHGSCRNPHHHSDDAMIGADKEIGSNINSIKDRPALMMLTGDQIYADDVAGPMLAAIHQTINLLGIHSENFEEAIISASQDLYEHENTYYQRNKILPKTKVGVKWYSKSGRYPVFTSFFSHNHLISFAEYIVMYILVWSPVLWKFIELDSVHIPDRFKKEYKKELKEINKFVEALPTIRRVMANIPLYMIFDDHDITDDWNMTALWEKAAYTHPFSKRIIGNGMMAYFLCQAWGNAPQKFGSLFFEKANLYFNTPSDDHQDQFIDTLLKFGNWHFEVPTLPKLIVLDARTQRWRSEKNLANPSGLMDWEALMELQQNLIDEDTAIIVAPAPIFGVKIIETIQNIVSFFGYPLAVDAENWMAHKGAAKALLQIFKHMNTPQKFIILSGDVHYSFVYDIVLRFRDSSPKIWQITSSGIKNEFPGKLLKWLDRMNRWLYAPYSPLNVFTKRRDMKIRVRIPKGREPNRLINTSGIGLVQIDEQGTPTQISELYANSDPMPFVPKKRNH